MTYHSDLSRKARLYFNTLKPDLIAIHKDQGRWSQKGISDWMLCYKGQSIFIELKSKKDNLFKLQKVFLEEAQRAGAIVAVCRSLPEIKQIIKNLKKER